MPAINKAEYEKRFNFIQKLLLEGKTTREINALAKKKFKIEERAVRDYIKAAYEEFSEIAKFERSSEFGKAIDRLNKLYTLALKSKNLKTALSIQKELNEMLGLKTLQVEHSGGVELTIKREIITRGLKDTVS
ncbi:MAG TPA: hypothetical protein VHO28_00995 [Ignavibacteriales bacterium]|nr:hypothetical protein [Ignavibacteriales bacterium]